MKTLPAGNAPGSASPAACLGGGSTETPREGVPRSVPEPAAEPAETLLALPPHLAQRLWFGWIATGISLSEKIKNQTTQIWGPKPCLGKGGVGAVNTPAAANRNRLMPAELRVTLLTDSCSRRREPASPSSLEQIKALLRAFPPRFGRMGKSKEWARKRDSLAERKTRL